MTTDNRQLDQQLICPLCQRPIPAGLASKHHLVPRLKGGKHGATALLHHICHTKIHTTLSETELARHYDTIEKLRQHPEIEKFVDWVRKRPADYRGRNRRSRSRR